MGRPLTAILSFLLATGLYGVGAFLCLVPTQGMKGNEGLPPVFLGYLVAFLLVSPVGAGIGLLPLRSVYGGEAWKRGLPGFAIGAVIAALGVALTLEAIVPRERGGHAVAYGLVYSLVFPVSLLSPPVGGLVALMTFRRKRRRPGQRI